MGKVEPKGGLANAFFGAVAGIVLLLIIQTLLSATSGNEFRFIPTLTFRDNPWEFIKDYLGFFTTTLGLIVLIGTIVFYAIGTYYVQKSKVEPPGTDVVENETAAFMRG